MAGCDNNCDAVAGLNESAANLVQYEKLIQSWLYGGADQTVDIGGVSTPTLLNLAMSIKQLVGVWPDGLTIRLSPDKKIYVPLDPNGGVKAGSNGLYTDFSDLPEDRLNEILKSIRVPIWLSAPLNIYVNQQTGSDTLDDGRGLSASKPFQTLNAALLYVSSTYNLYIYNVTVHIAQGYNSSGDIVLPSYTTTTGTIIITGPDQNHPEYAKIGHVSLQRAASYTLRHLTVIPQSKPSYFQGIYATSGVIDLQNVVVDISNYVSSAGTMYVLCTESAGSIRIWATDSAADKNGVRIKVSTTTSSPNLCFIYSLGGNINFAADILIEGSCTMNICAAASNAGTINRSLSNYVNPGRLPTVTATGTLTGKRYSATLNAIINTRSGGAEFFPGTVAGTTTTGGQYA